MGMKYYIYIKYTNLTIILNTIIENEAIYMSKNLYFLSYYF